MGPSKQYRGMLLGPWGLCAPAASVAKYGDPFEYGILFGLWPVLYTIA